MRLLVIEDDSETAAFLCRGLERSGHVPEHLSEGDTALARVQEGEYDALIVDRMLPGLDGLSLVMELRRKGWDTPVLFLTALGDVDDRVKGLRAGGDDYLTKPYALAELLARLEAVVRRRSGGHETLLRIADLELDRLARTVQRGGRRIPLKPREFRLLEYFMLHAGQVVTRSMLLEDVWGYHFDPQTNVVDVHVSRLRGKIDREFDVPLLHTVRGAGYCLRETH